MTPKSRRFASGIAALTLGAGATAAALVVAPGISGAAESPSSALIASTDEPDDTAEDTTTDDDAVDTEEATDQTDDGAADSPDAGFPGLPGEPGGPMRPGFPARHDRGPGLGRWRIASGEVIAEAIGIDVDQLREQLREGSTVAEIAEINGVDPQTVIDALVADYTERVTEWIEGAQPASDEVPADTDTTATTAA
jgi:hypothetical protein